MCSSDLDVRNWIATSLLPSGGVYIAQTSGGKIVAMMVISRDQTTGWIQQLYVAPAHTGRGIGRQLIALARRQLGSPTGLKETHGLVLVQNVPICAQQPGNAGSARYRLHAGLDGEPSVPSRLPGRSYRATPVVVGGGFGNDGRLCSRVWRL